jgi:hypothetical protein
LLDTGASLNVGRTEYHEAIAKSRPEIVEFFGYLKDLADTTPFTIGGINGDGPTTDIDAVISYKTPYVVNGVPVRLTLALGPSVATNSIISYPFLTSIKGTVMLENSTLVSALLGDSYKIEPMIPLRSDAPPIIPDFAPVAYNTQSKSPPVLRTPQLIVRLRQLPQPFPPLLTGSNLTPLGIRHDFTMGPAQTPKPIGTTEVYMFEAGPNQL